ncbi:MAG: leucine-rich repeat domain-containing protein [Clostridiales bacterium]|nr:leucine-rich repeat domain-containing protein [Clostridiales bacterium]
MKKALVFLMLIVLALTLTACQCKHTETQVINRKAATCLEEGYTGDTVCTACEETLTPGEAIPATGHSYGEPSYAQEATCKREGYTGDLYCTACGDMILGEVIPQKEHISSERISASEPTCTREGRTGYTYCLNCGNELEPSETIPATGHTLSEPTNVVEATCVSVGYSGDTVCTICERSFDGEEVAKLPHSFENDVCTACGWRTPGLYLDGAMQMTWEELVNNQYVSLRERRDEVQLMSVNTSMYGDLVVGEEVTYCASSAFKGSLLNTICFPIGCDTFEQQAFMDATQLTSVTFFGNDITLGQKSFSGCTSLKTVDFRGTVKRLQYECFRNCTALESFTLPADITKIEGSLLRGCTALTSFEIPAGVTEIEGYAFADCTGLTSLTIPEGVVNIGENLVNGSGITELVLPSTVEWLGTQMECTNLQLLDLSQTKISRMGGHAFYGSTGLKEVRLPGTLASFPCNAFNLCSSLEVLNIAHGTTEVTTLGWGNEFESNTALTTIIWPVTLTDGSRMACAPNLTTINFCGSQLQWDMTKSKDMFPNVEIVFNYEP